MKNVHTYTFGCKVNLFDTTQIESILKNQGGATVDHAKKYKPDTVVINTCTVTENADKQANQLIRKIHKNHPDANIVVTGCYAQAQGKEIEKMRGVNHVLDFDHQFEIAQKIGWAKETSVALPIVESPRTRANLKIQDGCQAYCSYCILPFVRGKSRSIEMNHILNQAQAYSAHGHYEVVITGTHIAGYGRDLNPRLRLSDVLYRLYESQPDLPIRISSLEPAGLTPDFFKALERVPTVRPHFHIPLQSGDDDILKKMNRKYKTKHYHDRIVRLSQVKPQSNIGSDVIVGFPTETNAQFEQTCHFVQSLPLTYLHVFPYSSRPQTASSRRKDDVSPLEKKQRVKILRTLGLEKKKVFFEQFQGVTKTIVVEKSRDVDGYLKGVTPEYISVHVQGGDRLMEKEIEVRLTHLTQDTKGDWYYQGEVL